MSKTRGSRIIGAVSLLAYATILYATVALTRFRFAYPELTETQITLHFWDAMMWRSLKP